MNFKNSLYLLTCQGPYDIEGLHFEQVTAEEERPYLSAKVEKAIRKKYETGL